MQRVGSLPASCSTPGLAWSLIGGGVFASVSVALAYWPTNQSEDYEARQLPESNPKDR